MGPGHVTPLLQLDIPVLASLVQVRSGIWELRPAHDGPPQVTVTATGKPKPQSAYVPWAFVVVVVIDEEVVGRCGLLTGLKFRSPRLGRNHEPRYALLSWFLSCFCV
jgi:hypothetical protein